MIYFFDTSALQHRYVDGHQRARGIRCIIGRQRNECYILDHTVLEIASALGAHCRRTNLDVKEFQRLDRAFWKDVADGRLKVHPATYKDIVRARHLLRHAGVEKKKKLGSADALIATSCLEFALNSQQPVTFCLEDWTLFHIVRDISAFSSVLKFRYIGVDKSAAKKKSPP